MNPRALPWTLLLLGCSPTPPPSPPEGPAKVAPVATLAPAEPAAQAQGAGALAASPSASAPAAPAAPTQASEPAGPPRRTLDELKREAQRELGERVTFAQVRENYLVVGAPGWGGVKGSAGFVERVLAALLNGRFAKDISRPMPVYLFGDAASYNAYCKARYSGECISIYGFFSPSDYRLVMNVGLGIGTLSHELVHPIVDADFPSSPTWLNEGIASLFEAPILPRDGEIHGAKNWRYPRLMAGLASPRDRAKVTLPALFALSDDDFRGDDEALNYAMARYFCQWMDAQGKLWAFYQGFRDGAARDPRGEAAFKAATGKTPAEASGEWLRWVRAL